MPAIRILADHVANQIAAGEVISGTDTTVIKEEPDHVSENMKSEATNPAHTFSETLNNNIH